MSPEAMISEDYNAEKLDVWSAVNYLHIIFY